MFDSGDTHLRRFRQNRTTATGDSYTAAASLQAPFTQGTYYLFLKTNAQSIVTEADHTNNVIVFGPITIGLPDLVPVTLSGPDISGTEEEIALSWVIENRGAGDASGWHDSVYFSTDDLLDDNDPWAGDFWQGNVIPAGESYEQSQTVQTPSVAGNYYLILHADSDNAIVERAEDNNVLVFGPIAVEDDPVRLIERLMDYVYDLNLQQGIENSLDAKAQAIVNALTNLNANDDVAAIGALEAFVNAVEAQQGSEISIDDAVELVREARRIIALLEDN